MNGHEKAVELLLKKGARPSIIDVNGVTPLHYAAYSGHLGVVQKLIEYGADPLAR
jgi:ankyrin repeat protein